MRPTRPLKKIKCPECGVELKADQKIAHLAKDHNDKHAQQVMEELEYL